MEGPAKEAASNVGASSSAPPPPWIELPHDITANILQRLGIEEILESAQKVCITWRNVSKADPSIWRKIHLSSKHCSGAKDWETICRQAVDRSQGQLMEITIGQFGSDMLLKYIAERSSKLRCLKLVFCHSVTAEAVIEATKKFPLLETLEIFNVKIFGESIEQVGRSCPMLKSFTLYDPMIGLEEKDDADALAIAKSMPELRHLSLTYANPMTNVGLEAILDGCPSLESLDLELCIQFALSGDLTECTKKIKSLRIVDTDDYDFDDEPYWPSFD